jgi:hypothetical protein
MVKFCAVCTCFFRTGAASTSISTAEGQRPYGTHGGTVYDSPRGPFGWCSSVVNLVLCMILFWDDMDCFFFHTIDWQTLSWIVEKIGGIIHRWKPDPRPLRWRRVRIQQPSSSWWSLAPQVGKVPEVPGSHGPKMCLGWRFLDRSQWLGSSGNLQETMDLPIKDDEFPLYLSRLPQNWTWDVQ